MSNPNLHLVQHVGAGFLRDADPKFPFMLTVNLSPPDFLVVAFVMLHGGSEIIKVQGMTVADLHQFIVLNDFRTHPRFRHLTITGPEGQVEKVTRGDPLPEAGSIGVPGA